MTENARAVASLIERIARLARSDVQAGDLHPAQWAALRYLAQANRFSRNPMALTRYLNSTRGTTSQTLIALGRKGFVSHVPSERDKRSVDLELTQAGWEKVRSDPELQLAECADAALGERVEDTRLLLSDLLRGLVERNEGRMFGQCRTCRHFQRNEAAESGEPHLCGLLNVGLSDADSALICVEQENPMPTTKR